MAAHAVLILFQIVCVSASSLSSEVVLATAAHEGNMRAHRRILTQATCTVLDGTPPSDLYPCTCGSETCLTGQRCHESASSCEAWAAVEDGQATAAATDMNLCWQGPASVHCPETRTSPGVKHVDPGVSGISLPIDVGAGDFTLLLSFKLYWLAVTATSVHFSSGEYIGLDGSDSRLFMSGGSWGSTTFHGPGPSAGEIHTLILTRESGTLTIALDGNHPFPARSLAASIDKVQVIPWRNKVEVFEFTLMMKACDVQDGTGLSTTFPCTCGTDTCMENELCFASANACQSQAVASTTATSSTTVTSTVADGQLLDHQAIPTRGAWDWEAFVMDGIQYLALANNRDGSNRNIDSKIYRWDGSSFVEAQSIPTVGAWDWQAFVMDGIQYLAVAHHYDDSTGSYNINSKIYRWDAGSFVEAQSIPTAGASQWEAFVMGGIQYLAVANKYDSSSYNIDSKIYRWDSGSFVEAHSIPTHGAVDLEAFLIGGVQYLAAASYYDGSSYSTNSKIYRWDDGSFVEAQSIPTHAASDWEAFVMDGVHYLAVANHHDSSSYNIDSKIYRWDSGSFVEAQSIPTAGAVDWEAFVMDGVQYLAVANGYDGSSRNIDSIIYRWDGSFFVEVQSIPTRGAWDWEAFVMDGIQYLAAASYYDGSSFNIDSIIYRQQVIPAFEFSICFVERGKK